jgi:hypothetical protein
VKTTARKNVLASVTTITSFLVLAGCVGEPASKLADGSSVRAMIAQQTNDPEATERNGTAAPVGTDPEIANAAVVGVRKASTRSTNTTSSPDITSITQAIGSR